MDELFCIIARMTAGNVEAEVRSFEQILSKIGPHPPLCRRLLNCILNRQEQAGRVELLQVLVRIEGPGAFARAQQSPQGATEDETGLDVAITRCGDYSVIEYILSIAPELINVADVHGWTPIYCAVVSRRSEQIIALLLRYGADVTRATIRGLLPIHKATTPGVAELLLGYYYDLPVGSESPILTALNRGNADVASPRVVAISYSAVFGVQCECTNWADYSGIGSNSVSAVRTATTRSEGIFGDESVWGCGGESGG